jgi:hypothetical protein
MPARKCLIITLSILTLNINLPAQPEPGLQSLCPQYKPTAVDISSLTDFYSSLAPDEKAEQLRDWAFYGLLSSLSIKPDEIENLTGMDFPMRYPSLKEKYKYPVMQGRAASPGENDCVILVAQNQTEDKLLIGSIYDKQRMPEGAAPKRAHIFAYSFDPAAKTINTVYVRTVSAKDLLSAEYGYCEKEITNAQALKDFLNSADDIVSARITDNSIILGGRKNSLGAGSALTFEDISGLYQAYLGQNISSGEKERKLQYEAFLKQKYFEVIKKDPNLKRAIRSGKVKYIDIMTRIKKVFPYRSLEDMDSNVGFSLDPLFDYDGIAADLKSLVEKTGRFSPVASSAALSKVVDSRAQAILSVASKVSSQKDITPLLKFRRGFAESKNPAERQIDSALRDAEQNNTYQQARYDGRMKGTSAAMILFYTDLTAKLWALDYNGMAPKNSVTGFNVLSEVKVPKLYWEDFVRLSKTRLWFALRGDSYDINGSSLYFEPVATRVYAASSDPLYPGKESKPNYQSGEFLGWWDRHYASVADYEPYYYKLNELLKWSCLMMVLKEKRSGCLGFLENEQVARNIDFEKWYNGNTALKNRTALPFVDRNRFNKSTECFKLLESKGYPLMGATFYVSGGVSLASRKDILAKLSKHGRGVAGRKAAAGKSTGRGAEYAKGAPTGKKSGKAPAEEPKKNGFGEFSAVAAGQTVKLSWNKNEGAVLDESVNSLAAVQANMGREGRSENIFKGVKDFQAVVRIEAGKTYIVKNARLKDKWIYLLIDPEGKTTGYPAKAAGSEPESSVFYAKAITSPQAQKLIADKKGVTLY